MLDPETGAEIWGEYDPVSGQYLQDIGVATGELDRNNVSTLSAQQYKSYQASYKKLTGDFPTAKLFTPQEYAKAIFTTADNVVVKQPALRTNTHVVLSAPVSDRNKEDNSFPVGTHWKLTGLYINDPKKVILAEYPINPTATLPDNAFSLLMNNESGEIQQTSTYRIGIKAGFFRDASGNIKETDASGSYRRDYDDEVLGGVPQVEVEGFGSSRGFTDKQGRFSLNFNYIPCPREYYSIDGYATAKLESRRFNPKMQSVPYPYYIERFYTVSCTPDMPFIVPFMGPMPITMGSPSIYPGRLDFPVDTMVLSGTAYLVDGPDKKPDPNSVPPVVAPKLIAVADKTEYVTQPTSLSRTVNDYFDFDGDGQNETVVKGYLKDTPNPDTGVIEKVFTTEGVDAVDAKLHLQGVYLSSGSRIPGQDAPDFTRAMDWSTNFTDEGMVKTISESDLRNTDLYVFRLSDGKLISERLGLAPDDWQYSDELGASAQTSRFFYHTYMRGYYGDLFRRIKGTYVNELNFGDWQAKSGINPELHQRQADHLKPGDRVELIAINRATGYMGSVQTTMQAAGSDAGLGRDLSWDIAPIKLQPPNLKIWVDRKYNINEGLRKGTIVKDQIIGYEGAALSSDNLIALSTEWLKPDGTDFPVSTDTASSDYGYTGRVAFLSGDNQIVSGSNVGVAQFPIKPGKHLQIIQLPNGANSNQHFYIQVSGEPATGKPIFGSAAKSANFDSTGVHDGKLKARPDRFVPFMVPVFDEKTTEAQRQTYRQLKEENPGQSFEKPAPIYQWVYRPEFQYSLYDLSIDKINRYEKDATDGEDILKATQPIITSSDDLIEILYNLDISKYTPVDYFNTGEEKELIFAIGEQELRAKINEKDKLEFANLEHLASLDAEDFLSIRLYTNNDAGNVLWEYAFLYLNLSVVDDSAIIGDDIVYVNADEPEIELATTIYGYASWDATQLAGFNNNVRWKVLSGNASLSQNITPIDQGGSAVTKVTLVPSTANEVVIEAELMGDSDAGNTATINIGVIAGKPHSISVAQSGTAYLKGRGDVEVTATVRDQNSNLVENGTAVFYREKGHINLASYTGLTDNGIVKGKITGGSIAGSFGLDISSGEAAASTTVAVQPLQVQFQNMPTQFVQGQSYDLTAKLSGGTGDLSGIYVDLGADQGLITTRESRTDANGELSFRYRAPLVPGNYQLAAKVDIEQPFVESITVAQPAQTPDTSASDYYLVSGTGGASTSTVNHYSGSNATLHYPTSNTLTVTGLEGEAWQLDLEDKHFINREPVYFSRFKNFRWDQLRSVEANFEDLTRSKTPYDNIYGSNPEDIIQGVWRLTALDGAPQAQPSYNFWLSPSTDGQVLDVANGSITLELQGSNLVASIKTFHLDAQNDPVITTHQVQSPAQINQWQSIAVGVKGSTFYLAIDDVEQTANLTESIYYPTLGSDSDWLVLGDGFTGSIAGLRIYDWSSDPLISVTPANGVFDSSGEAAVQTQLSAALQSQSTKLPGVSVRIRNSSSTGSTLNVLNKGTVDALAKSYYSVQSAGLSSLQTSDVLSAMPMDTLFPDPELGASGLMQRYTNESNSTSAQVNSVAAIAWLSHNARYEVLHNKVNTLQSYFADANRTDLTSYSAEYLQEAMIQASTGDTMWLRMMSTALTVWAEMIETNPSMANLIGNAVENRTDFWSWIRILSLPGDGWATDVIPVPRPENTCDLISHDVNAGSLLAFSTTPCRPSGAQMAGMLNTFVEVDPDINTQPALLTTYMTTLLTSLKQMPLEYTRLFQASEQQVVSNWEFSLVPKAHAAGPLVYGIRVLAVVLKQAIRKGAAGAPANFVAFLQGGTTSRVDPVEMLAAIAYLTSRFPDNACDDCEPLDDQVAETALLDMGIWFAGIGLSKKGQMNDTDVLRRSCTISNQAHGKAFELLATAAYHALYEFGNDVGLSNPSQYRILLSDPREGLDEIIEVPIMQNSGGTLEKYTGSPHQRKPDLVLYGDGEEERTWVELKSWRYNDGNNGPRYYNASSNKLDAAKFPLWDGKSKGDAVKSYTAKAHKQAFLDYAASRDELIDIWSDEPFGDSKPNKTITWMQVWQPGKRTWKELKRDAQGKYTLGDKVQPINVATPWIGEGDLTEQGIITGTTPQFKALQRYLAAAPSGISPNAFKNTIGYSKKDHQTNYIDGPNGQGGQVADSVDDFFEPTMKVKPFTLAMFFAIHAGEDASKQLQKAILDQFGDSEFAELRKAIIENNLTKEQLEDLRESITEKMLELMGPFKYLAMDIWLLSDVENAVVDLFLPEEIDQIRDFAANLELPEDYFEVQCETP